MSDNVHPLRAPLQALKPDLCEKLQQPEQALAKSGRVPECHAEQHLPGQACLDRGITVIELPAALAARRGLPSHGGIRPDRQRPTALERPFYSGQFLV